MAVFEPSDGPTINLDAVVYSQRITYGSPTRDPADDGSIVEDDSAVIVSLVDGSSYTFRGEDATAFNTTYNP